MRTKSLFTLALALLLTGIAWLPQTVGQEAPKEGEAQLKPSDSYKVEFTVSELDSGKKFNSRSYSMLIRAEAIPKFTDVKTLRIGSKVPYSTSTVTGSFSNAIQYQDVGMNIDCRLLPMGNGNVVIGATWDYTSLGDKQESNIDAQHPVFRQVRSNVESVVHLDKPTALAEIDDVASTHRYVFEVKATKMVP